MATTTLFPPSSSFLSPPTKTLKHFSLLTRKHSLSKHPISISATSLQSQQTSLSQIPQKVQTFWKWLAEQGVVSAKSAVKPGIVPEGLGLIAQRDIGRNEVVLEVPNRLWLNQDMVAGSEIGGVCGGLKPWVSVALFLLREKLMEKSKWRVYLDILPNSTDSTIFWSEEELAELQGTQLLSTTLGVKEYVENEFLKVQDEILIPHKHLFPSPISSNDFLWAFGILRSRAFSRLRGQNLVLIPLADLINHSPTIATEDHAWEIKGAGFFSKDLIFSLRAPVSVKAGEQVLIQYDYNKSNAELALDYGFVESTRNRNAYTLTLAIPESDPFYGDKLDIAESNGLGETAHFDIVLGQSLPPLMLQYLRLLALGGTDAFLLESIFNNTIWGHLALPVSRTNEESICRAVRDACKSAFSGYKTSIEEDEKLMEGEKLSLRLKIAVEIRAGEKKVIEQVDGIFKERELELDVLEYYQERRLKDLGLVGEPGDIIFWEPK